MTTEFWLQGVIGVGCTLGSVLVAELVRDSRHALAHLYPQLMPKHNWHHRIFRPDLTIKDPEFYRQAQWHHDVPEAVTMMIATGLIWLACLIWLPIASWFTGFGLLYSFSFLVTGIGRAKGWEWKTDLTHQPGAFTQIPDVWWVNRTYHWRHHFDDTNAYFGGTFTLLDKLMSTSVSLQGKTIAITGSSGSMGRALLQQLQQAGAKVIALTSQPDPIWLEGSDAPVETIQWQIGQEDQLFSLCERIDILVLNHGVNVMAERTSEAIQRSYEINTFSSWRLLEIFLKTVRTNAEIACKEVWVNTSEAEVLPAFSPLYELSKRALGELITLRRLDAPCVIRKLILGPFKSKLNPVGIMNSDWVARQIVQQVKRDVRNIVVTVDPLTFGLVPWKEFWLTLYFKLFSRSASDPSRTSDPQGSRSEPEKASA